MTTSTATGLLDVRLLGGFAVAVNGQLLPPSAWRRKRVAALVKLLALDPGHRLHREQILEALWPELDPDAADNNLRFTLHEARKRLASAGARPKVFLAREGEVLVLAPSEALTVDSDAFERAAATAWSSDDPAVTAAAIGRYSGDILPDDPYEEWAESRRAALRAGYLALLRRLAELHLKRGEGSAAVAALQRLVRAEPGDEAAHVRLMKVLARTGERQRALAQYGNLVESLQREIGVPPEPATTRLRDEIAAGRYPPPRREPAEATPPRAETDSPRVALPAPVDALIGREREVAEIGQVLAAARLVTLTGPGGVGKTRLALEIGHEIASSFPDGAVFVDLAPLRDPALVVAAIAQAVGVREEPGVPLLVTLQTGLRARRALLLLDNFEQVAEAGTAVIAVLAACPGVRALVTSRVRLRLRGEREYPIGPLALPEPAVVMPGAALADAIALSPAVALFVERARQAKPSFSLTESNAAHVAAICHRLDGLPLALELAAAWSKLLPPAAMRARLATGRLALTGGARDLPERQRTIRATIAWSYELLTPGQQRLFRGLAVFAGGWLLDAAEAVGAAVPDSEIDVLEGLRGLVDQSLVVDQAQPGGEPRFAMLETIREFGLERLAASGEEETIRRAHLAHLVWLAEEQFAARYLPAENPHLDQIALLDRLEAELGNIRAALTWAQAHDPHAALHLAGTLMWLWDLRGHTSEGRDWLEALLALPESAARDAARGRALQGLSNLAIIQGEAALTARLREEALSIRRAVGDPRFVASSLWSLGEAVSLLGDLEGAERFIAEGLTLAQEIGHEYVITGALEKLGNVAIERGNLERAAALFTEGLARARAQRDQITAAIMLLELGRVARLRSDLGQAVEHLEEALRNFRGLREVTGASESLLQLALIAVARGDAAEAAALIDEGLELAQAFGGRGNIAEGLDTAAQLVASGRPLEAARLLGAAAALREAIGSPLRASERDEHERIVETVRAALGEAAYAAAFAEGQRMDLEGALSLVSTILDEVAQAALSQTSGASPSQARIEGVAQAVADEGDGQHGDVDHQPGDGDVRP